VSSLAWMTSVGAVIRSRSNSPRSNRGLLEIRTGGFRTLFCQKGGVIWILHICKKEDQGAGIEAARARMMKL
jgi:hypothetical protein